MDEPARDRWASAGWLALGLALVAALGWLVAARQGNLAWDDADYLRDGLRVANLVRASGWSRPDRAVDALLGVRPKPPLLVAWIAGGSLVSSGRAGPIALVVFASVVPFAILIGAVVAVARDLWGTRAGPIAVLVVVASPMALSFGAKVMVETFMGLWVLLAFYAAARLIDRPTRGPALALGAALGCALLTKMTVGLLLPVPALAFAVGFLRRHGLGRDAVRVVAWVAGPLLGIALPWYLANGRAAVEFAAFSARYNVVALGESGGVPRLERLARLAHDLAGWPLVATLVVAAGVRLVAGGRGESREVGRAVASAWFVRLAALGAGSGAAILMVPAYFDPRFLLPAWPALAVALAPILSDITARPKTLPSLATFGLLGASLFASVGRLAGEEPTRTFWGARALIDRLVAEHGAANVYNVGSCRDWNVSKTGLINELRDRPGDCFVLHDVSGGTPDEIVRRLTKADAVVALDLGRIPAGWLAYGPKLNRGTLDAINYLAVSPDFRRVETIAGADLPPLLVFVRKRRE